jgi:protein-S-isoprenylcysteine O-methyltransferase Ste14
VLVVIAGKITLGRSFGLVPANRGVVIAGPYTLVRHPIYAGYLISHVAFACAYPTAWNISVLVVTDVALVLRALCEERVLAADLKYQMYCRRVAWHLVPGVF